MPRKRLFTVLLALGGVLLGVLVQLGTNALKVTWDFVTSEDPRIGPVLATFAFCCVVAPALLGGLLGDLVDRSVFGVKLKQRVRFSELLKN